MRTLRHLRNRGVHLLTVVVHRVNQLQCRLSEHHWEPERGVCIRCGARAW